MTGKDAACFEELLRQNGGSVSDLLRAALREYYRNRLPAKLGAKQLLQGFVAAGEGPQDLALEYKRYLSEELADKLNTEYRVHETHALYTGAAKEKP
ncbi:hypothetical protein AXE65_10720 [Ventosimonas gracilis]|uniref:Ribbon-helix-helix protein CopG domain-containing protein n=1 Tax=Ventosimonas gracilis TaxID=1680762 RepID=A0A139SWT9_9GAMM|nr:hypothetical protein AXE65_10720 [Ventosimonas gracilis]